MTESSNSPRQPGAVAQRARVHEAIAELQRLSAAFQRRRVQLARENLDRIAERLARESVDIIALQEVDVCWSGRDTLHQADYLADALGMNVCFQPSFDYHLPGFARVTSSRPGVSSGT